MADWERRRVCDEFLWNYTFFSGLDLCYVRLSVRFISVRRLITQTHIVNSYFSFSTNVEFWLAHDELSLAALHRRPQSFSKKTKEVTILACPWQHKFKICLAEELWNHVAFCIARQARSMKHAVEPHDLHKLGQIMNWDINILIKLLFTQSY